MNMQIRDVLIASVYIQIYRFINKIIPTLRRRGETGAERSGENGEEDRRYAGSFVDGFTDEDFISQSGDSSAG